MASLNGHSGVSTEFARFTKEVRDSIGKHAKRKNYVPNGNHFILRLLFNELGIATGHAIGEIIYKCIEYVKHPRRVIMVKVASWAFVEWRDCDKP